MQQSFRLAFRALSNLRDEAMSIHTSPERLHEMYLSENIKHIFIATNPNISEKTIRLFLEHEKFDLIDEALKLEFKAFTPELLVELYENSKCSKDAIAKHVNMPKYFIDNKLNNLQDDTHLFVSNRYLTEKQADNLLEANARKNNDSTLKWLLLKTGKCSLKSIVPIAFEKLDDSNEIISMLKAIQEEAQTILLEKKHDEFITYLAESNFIPEDNSYLPKEWIKKLLGWGSW